MHLDAEDDGALEALEQRRVEVFAKLDIHQVILSTGWAVRGGVLSAH